MTSSLVELPLGDPQPSYANTTLARSAILSLITSEGGPHATLARVGWVKAKRQLEGDFYAFVTSAWPILEPKHPMVAGWYLRAICMHLEAVSRGWIKRLIINIPPRHGKSTLMVLWMCWTWTTQPSKRFLCASYANKLALRDSRRCRKVLQSDWYRERWPHVQLTKDTEAEFENTATGYRKITSVEAGGVGEGGDINLCDDPLDALEAIKSPAAVENAWEWWENTWEQRVNDFEETAFVLIMQRLHAQDPAGRLLERGGWDLLCLPTEYEGEPRSDTFLTRLPVDDPRHWQDPRSQIGELLCPERKGPDAVLRAKIRPDRFASQDQQRPNPPGGTVWKRVWWRYWMPKGAALPDVAIRLDDGRYQYIKPIEVPDAFDEKLQSWDMAFKDTAGSSFVAGQVWGRTAARFFMLDFFCERVDFPQTLAALLAMSRRHPDALAKLVEDKANGPAVMAMLRGKVAGLIPIGAQGSKEARANAVAPAMEAGDVYLPHPMLYLWVDRFLTIADGFPKAKPDDPIDAASQALTYMLNRAGVPDDDTFESFAGDLRYDRTR